MLRSGFLSLALVTGFIPVAFARYTSPPIPSAPTTFEALSEDLSTPHWGPTFINYPGGTPEKKFQPGDPRSSNTFFVLLNPLLPEPRNGDDVAWLYHAWEIRQEWEQAVAVAETRELRSLAHPVYLAEMDAQEMSIPLTEEAEAEPEAQAEVAPATPVPAPPSRTTRFAPQTAVLLTLFVGLLGLIFIKPKQLPGQHR